MPHKKLLPNKRLMPINAPCPCGNTKPLTDCCLPFIEARNMAPTAEALMRSRYTAHSLLAIDYLWDTWSPERRLRSDKTAIYQWAASCEWLGLQIINTSAGGIGNDKGLVEFLAIYRQDGLLQQHHEVSIFKRVNKQWFYVDHQG